MTQMRTTTILTSCKASAASNTHTHTLRCHPKLIQPQTTQQCLVSPFCPLSIEDPLCISGYLALDNLLPCSDKA